MANIKQEFIKQILQDEGKRFTFNQGLEIERRLEFHTGRLFRERSFNVNSEGEDGARLVLTFPGYLRFLDIRKLKAPRKKSNKRNSNKGYRIYNRFAMGHYYSIARRVSVEFTDKVVQSIRDTFNTPGNGN